MAPVEIGYSVPAIVLMFSKSAIAIQTIQSERATQAKPHQRKLSNEHTILERNLLRLLLAGASKLRDEYHEYLEAHGQAFFAGDERSRYLLSRCWIDAKVMYQIVGLWDYLSFDRARKLYGMAHRSQFQVQAVMAGLGLRIVQKRELAASPLESPCVDFVRFSDTEARTSRGFPACLSLGDDCGDTRAMSGSSVYHHVDDGETLPATGSSGSGQNVLPGLEVVLTEETTYPERPATGYPSSRGSDDSGDDSEGSLMSRSLSGSTNSSVQSQSDLDAVPPCPLRAPPAPPRSTHSRLNTQDQKHTGIPMQPPCLGVPPQSFSHSNAMPYPDEMNIGLTKLAIYSQSTLFTSNAKNFSYAFKSSMDSSASSRTFCPGARRIQEDPEVNLEVSRRPVGRYAFVDYYRCPQHECTFRGPKPRSTVGKKLGTSITKSESGVRYRWVFLAKSHTSSSSGKNSAGHRPKLGYKCLVCHHEGITNVDIYEDAEELMWHLRKEHNTMSMYVQKRLKCVVARDPLPGEDYDLLIPLVDESGRNGKRVVFEIPEKVDGDGKDAAPRPAIDQDTRRVSRGVARLLLPKPSTELIIAMSRPQIGMAI